MPSIDAIIVLLVVAVPLVALANRVGVAFPVVLVIGGLALGFVPNLPHIELTPDLVLLVFLPPLLYWSALTAPTGAMRHDAVEIAPLAVGLVVATTGAVAAAVRWLVPGIPWTVAVALGAIVAPTDGAAAIPIARALGISRRTVAVIEGESLLNDATALVIYAAAVGATVAGSTFAVADAAAAFPLVAAGSVVFGLVVGRVVVEGWRRIGDPQIQGLIAVVVPFVAYEPALRLGLSGVLAVVAAGLYVNRHIATAMLPAARMKVTGYWETMVFLSNLVLFIITGIELHEIARRALTHQPWWHLLRDGLIVTGVVVALRFLWIFAQGRLIARHRQTELAHWKHRLVMGWAGMRGAVSLAAALAMPTVMNNGMPVPHRELVIVLTFSVILLTLVAGGLSMPAVLRRLRIAADDGDAVDERRARRALADAAAAMAAQLELRGQLSPAYRDRLRARYDRRRRRVDDGDRDVGADAARRHWEIERTLLAAERRELEALRRRGAIENTVVHRLQDELDAAEAVLDGRFGGGAPGEACVGA